MRQTNDWRSAHVIALTLTDNFPRFLVVNVKTISREEKSKSSVGAALANASINCGIESQRGRQPQLGN